VIVPDAFFVLDFMLFEMADILERLVVHASHMLENLDLTQGLIYSQPVLLALVDAGMDRQEAYKVVQGNAHRALSGGPRFQDGLAADSTVAEWLGTAELSSLFDPMRQLQHIDEIFSRVGLSEGVLEKTTG